MTTTTRSFNGPLFVFGMPRSGTKLLRGLLNEHQMIGIVSIETEFILYWKNNWEYYGNLSDTESFEIFYKNCLKLRYFTYMNNMGKLIDCEVWYNYCKSFSLNGVFEALIRHDADVNYGTKKIWGDKSPSYIRHITQLKDIYPDARFIHIIRDVRDYCLSINNAWGKNMVRAAQRWVNDVQKCKTDSIAFADDYLEIKYEELLDNTQNEMEKICKFLDLEFDYKMLHLSAPTENIGYAKDQSKIIRNNTCKYLTEMGPLFTDKD